MAASRRTVIAHDRKRSSTARKRTHRRTIQEQQQQAEVFSRLWRQARADLKSAQAG